ncbi:MAG TPA: nuclear transport factor 2 family protein [Candidatus Acidoferrum sp.]|nr:nuclear transport factor 2 family protein [Candidatus Acidoferrum sp.]
MSLCFVALILSTGIARAQEPDQPVNPEMQRQELINLEKENARALQLHNTTFFKSVYSEDFTGVTRFGETLNKLGILREVQTMPQEFESVVSTDAQVRVYRETASVLSLRSEVGRLNGKKFYNQFRVLRLYINTSRGWRVVSQLETRLANDENH